MLRVAAVRLSWSASVVGHSVSRGGAFSLPGIRNESPTTYECPEESLLYYCFFALRILVSASALSLHDRSLDQLHRHVTMSAAASNPASRDAAAVAPAPQDEPGDGSLDYDSEDAARAEEREVPGESLPELPQKLALIREEAEELIDTVPFKDVLGALVQAADNTEFVQEVLAPIVRCMLRSLRSLRPLRPLRPLPG